MIAQQGRSLDQFCSSAAKGRANARGTVNVTLLEDSEVRWLIKGYQRVQQWEKSFWAEFESHLKNSPSPCRKSFQHQFLLAFVSQGAKVFREPAFFLSHQKLLFLKMNLGWSSFAEKASLKKNILVSQGRCYFVGSSLVDSTSSYTEKRQ